MSNRAWGISAAVGAIYRYDAATDKHRLASCRRAPANGSLLLCMAHAGDHFYDYTLLKQEPDGRWKKVRPISGYSFGTGVCGLTSRQYHLLMAGEAVEIPKLSRAVLGNGAKGANPRR